MAGPEEMKWPQKELYTYNVQNGDRFILDEKVPLTRLRTRNSSSGSLCSPKGNSPNYRFSFSVSPRFGGMSPSAGAGVTPSKKEPASQRGAKAARNLFGGGEKGPKQ